MSMLYAQQGRPKTTKIPTVKSERGYYIYNRRTEQEMLDGRGYRRTEQEMLDGRRYRRTEHEMLDVRRYRRTKQEMLFQANSF